jgi:hypothetical protein
MIGDQIFFGERGNEYHTGIVVDVDDNYVYTVEGNSSEMVSERKYLLSDNSISGYGHPNYSDSFKSASTSTSATKPSAPKQSTVTFPFVTYKVRTSGRWLPEVKDLEDYAGINGEPITDIAIKVSNGSIKYRVHVLGGDWLPYVTGYDVSDYDNGYAGNGQIIDAVEVYYNTPSDIVNKYGYLKAKYRVSPTGRRFYDWQYDDETINGQDGYAGAFGVAIDGFQMVLEKD